MKTTKKAIALGAALAAVAILMAAAAGEAGAVTAANGFKAAKFRVEIKGTQQARLIDTHAASGECDVSDFSTGTEKLTFRTAKPVIITAFDSPGGGLDPEIFAGRRLGIPTVATLERSFAPKIIGPADPACAQNGGEATGSGSDCGRRRLRLPIILQYGEEAKDGLEISSGLSEETLYQRCPAPAPTESFPFLLAKEKAGRPIVATLPPKDLFDPRFKQWISIADGTGETISEEEWHETKLHWEVSFTRIKEER
jgi:hypothetical protein